MKRLLDKNKDRDRKDSEKEKDKEIKRKKSQLTHKHKKTVISYQKLCLTYETKYQLLSETEKDKTQINQDNLLVI